MNQEMPPTEGSENEERENAVWNLDRTQLVPESEREEERQNRYDGLEDRNNP